MADAFFRRDEARRLWTYTQSMIPVPDGWRAICLKLLVKTRGAPSLEREFVADLMICSLVTPRQAARFDALWALYVGEPTTQPSQY